MSDQIEDYIIQRISDECQGTVVSIDAGFFNTMFGFLKDECLDDNGTYSDEDLAWAYDAASVEMLEAEQD